MQKRLTEIIEKKNIGTVAIIRQDNNEYPASQIFKTSFANFSRFAKERN